MKTSIAPISSVVRCLLLSCAVSYATNAAAEPGFSPAEHSLITALFKMIQPRSFEDGIEYCGYILRDRSGNLRITGPVAGDAESCAAPFPEWGDPLASWHTHGSFDPDTYGEVPSEIDVRTDAEEGVDGWVATPGGRLWHVSGAEMAVELICGRGCLPDDPDYDPAFTLPIAETYDLDALIERLRSK